MQKPTVLYVYDALCGWCYGFSPVIRQLYDRYKTEFDFTVLSGGMMTGSRVRPVRESMAYIQDAYKVVEDRTGVEFGTAYLNGLLREGSYLSDSTKPGMAMTLFKAILPERAVEFAGTLQHALYYNGIDLNVDANYGPLVEPYEIDPDEFVAHVSDPAIQQQTQAEFDLVSGYGISGFPSVIFGKGDQLFLVARGYLPYDALKANMNQAMQA